ncbi:MAG TPA: DUF456 domain-containing protein [Balneolaceae bacterium]|nr:hypothetical protein [Balneola sp.]HBQ60659.1 DUF456 domain-containing protein [Balneolaceae bacterium]|tara:strand:- start:55044 stop:55514 length:471 start_codon:yes stop_codon:yes gene_type:complete
METIILIFGALLIIAGLIGAFLPVVPGLPFSYAGLLVLQFVSAPFSLTFMLIWAGIAILFGFVLDNVIPAWATKRSGGSPYAVTGSVVGLVAGLFFPPLGFVIGPLIGAFAGEILAGQRSDRALKSALGAFAGFMAATGLKVIAAGIMGFYFFTNL